MSRLAPVDHATASGRSRELLDRVERSLGTVPLMTRVMATSPAVLDGYLALAGALARGSLGAAVAERVALAVAAENDCGYCASAHTVLGARAGVSPDELDAALHGRSQDERTAACIALALAVVRQRGAVADGDLAAARTAGLDDAAIAEVVAHVALNVLTNYLNSLARTEIDFPVVDLPGRTGTHRAA
ncbi:carboxymuconolactone decarboxylase family protein [Kineococcus sp. NUM-3379]